MSWRRTILDVLDGLQLALFVAIAVFGVMYAAVVVMILLQGSVAAIRWIFLI